MLTQCLPAQCAVSLPPLPRVVRDALPAGDALRGGVLVLGNFDGFHLGHRALVRQARRMAGGAAVAVMSCEPHPRAFFGGDERFRLATPDSRQWLLAEEGVDYLYSPRFDAAFAGLSPESFAEQVLAGALGVGAVVAGADFRFGRGRKGDMAILAGLGARFGFRTCVADRVTCDGARISSTRIREALREGDLRGAERLLGAPWLVEVLRAPDAGLQLHPLLCRPKAGTYFGRPDGGRLCRVRITEAGGFHPDAPPRPGFWRLSAASGEVAP